jgi:hypothetical protein
LLNRPSNRVQGPVPIERSVLRRKLGAVWPPALYEASLRFEYIRAVGAIHACVNDSRPLFSRGTSPSENWFTVHLDDFSYGPSSTYPCRLTLFRRADGRLMVGMIVLGSARFETGYDRESYLGRGTYGEPERLIPRRDDGSDPPNDPSEPDYDDWWGTWCEPLVEHPWPRNRAFLLNILDRLRSVLPVENVSFDQSF